jgi:hypothetical protein
MSGRPEVRWLLHRPMFWLYSVAASVAMVAIVATMVGCSDAREHFPPLLTVSEIGPAEVEVGERIEVRGAGFPVGRVAEVTMHGALHRLGEQPIEDATIAIRGFAASHSVVELRVDEEVRAAFAGGSPHASFAGEVMVAFPAVHGGFSPVYGVLAHATLDIRGPPRGAAQNGRETARASGAETLRLHGIGAELDGTQVRVTMVDDASLADKSAIAVGDVIVAWDGLRVSSLADISVTSEGRAIPVLIRHADSAKEDQVLLPVHPDLVAIPRDALVGLFALLLLAVASSILFGRSWKALRSVLLALLHSSSRNEASWCFPPLSAGARSALSFDVERSSSPTWYRALRAGAGVLIIGLFAALPFLGFFVVRDFDIPIVVCVFTSISMFALCTGYVAGVSAPRRVLDALALQLPLSLLLLCICFLLGTSRFSEMSLTQGASPWQWNVFRDPAWGALFTLVVIGSMVVPKYHVVPSASALKSLLWRLRAALAAALTTEFFLGAGRLPETWEVSRRHDLVLALGAGWFALKALVVLLGLERLATGAIAVPSRRLLRFASTRLLLPAVLALFVAEWALYTDVSRRTAGLLAPATFGLWTLVAIRVCVSLWPRAWRVPMRTMRTMRTSERQAAADTDFGLRL